MATDLVRSKLLVRASGASFGALIMLLGGLIFATVSNAAPNRNGVTVIIGNANYGNAIPKVSYAHRDADAMRAYIRDVLGFDKDNIIDLRDAAKADLEAVFGNERSHKGKLWRFADPSGSSDIVVFYSGHGVPGLNDKRGYLLPVNAQPDTAEINGYSIDTLYANLAKIKAKSRMVLLDACFSGESPKGMLIKGASAVLVSAKVLPKKLRKRSPITVIAAAAAGQLASWDETARHGLFTRYFLDGAYGKADRDGDGRVTLGEIQRYLDRHMTRAARREYGRDQQASIRGNKRTVLGPVSKSGFWRQEPSRKAVVVKQKIQVAAIQQPVKSMPPAIRKTAPTVTKKSGAKSLDGAWKDGEGLHLDIIGSKVKIMLETPGGFEYMETSIAANGAIKQAYANMGRGGVIITGSLKKMQVDFTGVFAYLSRRVTLRKK